MITFTLLIAVLGIGFGIRKLCLLALGSLRKAAQIETVKPASATH
ncbi:MAG TPA: hypothetical protein VFE23_20005 [Usitatibacter sp.]|jgi:hypothetical protein|nr:hypothetical protein [Usitatibacter sp.]